MSIPQYLLLAWFAFSGFMLVKQVGKPRKPVEAEAAAFGLLITVLLCTLVVLA